eukprot:g41942.t1
MLLRDMIAYVQNSGVAACLISLSQEKAFDRILHMYRTDYRKVLGIWYRGARVCTKSWEEHIAKVKQKLVLWEHCSLSIVAIFHFIWKPKIDWVCRDSMYKTLDKGVENVPNVALTLMDIFVCGCIKLCVDPTETCKENTFHHKSIRKWSACSVLETLRKKERVGPVAWFPVQTVKVIGRMPHHQNFPTDAELEGAQRSFQDGARARNVNPFREILAEIVGTADAGESEIT